MSFLDEARAASKIGPRCGIARVLAALDDDLRADVEAAIADASINASAIAKALKARGVQGVPSDSTWQVHRRGACKCDG